MVVEVRTGAVAPRVALSAAGGDPQLGADPAMEPLGNRLGGFDGDAVHEIRLRVFARRLQFLEPAARLIANRHDLQRQDVHVSRFDGTEIVGETEPVAPFLSWEREPSQLAKRSTVTGQRGRI